MYAYGSHPSRNNNENQSSTPEGDNNDNANSEVVDNYMTNTSKVPILRPIKSPATFEALEKDFPEFFKHVYPESSHALLGPGDLLVFPPGWWHAMSGVGEGPIWSVSMWY